MQPPYFGANSTDVNERLLMTASRRMLDALPGSIIVAAALPVAVNGGPVVMFAILAAIVATIVSRNDFIAVIVGMAVAALLRAAGFGG